jgi:hypothetical protein
MDWIPIDAWFAAHRRKQNARWVVPYADDGVPAAPNPDRPMAELAEYEERQERKRRRGPRLVGHLVEGERCVINHSHPKHQPSDRCQCGCLWCEVVA